MRDLTAGVELAAMSMPQSLGYASIAGMPAVTGLYTLLLPILGFSAVGSSPSLVVAADSATAAILAGGLSRLAASGTAHYVVLASFVALLTAGFLLIARVLKLGFIADFLSQTVLTGFLTGVGVQIAIAVTGKMLGIHISSTRSLQQLGEIGRQLSAVHLPSLALSLAVVLSVFAMARLTPRIPGPLLAVVGSVIASAVWDFSARGIATIGPVSRGLPHLTIPNVSWAELEALVPLAVSCFVMIVTQSAATARIYALRYQQPMDENADLLGLSAANGMAALCGTFVVNGSPSQTAVADSSGARSQLAQICAAAVVGLFLLFFNDQLRYMPQCVLGAIVFIVALRLIDLKSLVAIRRESPGEFSLAAITAIVVVVVGVEQGIILAMVMSLLRIVGHSYHPHTAVLREGEGGIWRLTPAVPGAVTEPGLVVYRFGAPLFYANVGHFAQEIRGLAQPSVRWIVVDAGAITKLDFTAARVIQVLYGELRDRNVNLLFAHVQQDLQDDLKRHHLINVMGADSIYDQLHEALAHCRQLPAGG